MGRKLEYRQRNENVIAVWLYEKGYKREDISKLLRVGYTRLHVVLANPMQLTGVQMQVLSNATGRPIIDILRAIFMHDSAPPNAPELWHDSDD